MEMKVTISPPNLGLFAVQAMGPFIGYEYSQAIEQRGFSTNSYQAAKTTTHNSAFGRDKTWWQRKMLTHRRYIPNALVVRAYLQRHIPFPDRTFLTFSPFGINQEVFQNFKSIAAQYPAMHNSLRIGCFGAGLHDEAGFIMAKAQQDLKGTPEAAVRMMALSDRDVASYLTQLQTELFGSIASVCYEPRELLALLFGRGKRNGEIHVFDRDARIAQSLADSQFTVTNALDDTVDHAFHGAYGLSDKLRDYWHLLAQGRHVFSREYNGRVSSSPEEPLRSWSFNFASHELDKIRTHTLDLATDPLPHDINPFDLSVWLSTWYWFDDAMAQIVFARIVHNTRAKGYIITDYFAEKNSDQAARLSKAYGVEIIAANHNSFTANRITSHLLRKVEESEDVALLSSLSAPSASKKASAT